MKVSWLRWVGKGKGNALMESAGIDEITPANNEIGVIQPIEAISAMVWDHPFCLPHMDAVPDPEEKG